MAVLASCRLAVAGGSRGRSLSRWPDEPRGTNEFCAHNGSGLPGEQAGADLIWPLGATVSRTVMSRLRSSGCFYLGPCSARRGMLNPLIDRRLKRDAALRALLRDGDVERRAWRPAG